MLQIASINSGSNGNCYYVGNEREAVLIDTGLSCRETERRMKRIGLSMDRVQGIFISHEHSDHIAGLGQISNKYNLHVYGTQRTLNQGRIQAEHRRKVHLTEPYTVQIGALTVTAFCKHHDAADPVSFTVSNGRETIGVFTDIGTPCKDLAHHFSLCHAAFLESNYDEEMLANGRYPYFLKNRITGGKGHLSNAQALSLFRQHRAPFLSHLILAHLSRDNNNPALVASLFNDCADGVEIVVASRYKESEVYEIVAAPPAGMRAAAIAQSLKAQKPLSMQTTLF